MIINHYNTITATSNQKKKYFVSSVNMYEAWFMQKSLSNQVHLCNQCEPVCEICVGQSFALKQTSRLHGILMKWLDFAHEYLPNKNYLDCIYSLDYDVIQKCKKKI